MGRDVAGRHLVGFGSAFRQMVIWAQPSYTFGFRQKPTQVQQTVINGRHFLNEVTIFLELNPQIHNLKKNMFMKFSSLTLIFLFLFNTLQAQNEPYIPLVVEDHSWFIVHVPSGGTATGYSHYFLGDSILDGFVYKKHFSKVYSTPSFGDYSWGEWHKFFIGVEPHEEKLTSIWREDFEARKVYARFLDENPFCPAREEVLIYDFNFQRDRELHASCMFLGRPLFKMNDIYDEEIKGKEVKRIELFPISSDYVETNYFMGFGSALGPFNLIETQSVIAKGGEFLVKFCEGIPEEDCWKRIVSTKNVQAQTTFNVFPNPTEGVLKVEIEFDKSREGILSVSNMLGQTLLSKLVSGLPINETLFLEELEAGIYIISYSEEGQIVESKKFLKQ